WALCSWMKAVSWQAPHVSAVETGLPDFNTFSPSASSSGNTGCIGEPGAGGASCAAVERTARASAATPASRPAASSARAGREMWGRIAGFIAGCLLRSTLVRRGASAPLGGVAVIAERLPVHAAVLAVALGAGQRLAGRGDHVGRGPVHHRLGEAVLAAVGQPGCLRAQLERLVPVELRPEAALADGLRL